MDFFSNMFSSKSLGYATSVNVDKEIKIKHIYLTDLSSEALFFHYFEGKVDNISYDKVNSDISSTASSVESLKSSGRLWSLPCVLLNYTEKVTDKSIISENDPSARWKELLSEQIWEGLMEKDPLMGFVEVQGMRVASN